jgi:hypothetical protein
VSTDRVDVIFGAQISQLIASLGEVTGAVRESTEAMTASFEGLTAVMESAFAPLIAITAVLEGGEIFKESIDKTAELGVQLEVMSQKTGMGVEALSALQYAANLSDVSLGDLNTGLTRLARGMEGAQKGTGPAADAFGRLGVSAVNNSGQLRPMQDVLLDLAARFATMPDGAGKTAAALDLFGRSGANMIPLLNQGAEGIATLEAKAKSLGVTMGQDGVDTANRYVDAMKDFHAVVDSVERLLALTLMPALTDIAKAMTDLGANSDVVKGVMNALAAGIRLTAGTLVEFVGTVHALNTVMSADLTKTGEFTAAWHKAKTELEAVGKAMRVIFEGSSGQTVKGPDVKKGDDLPGADKPAKPLSQLDEWAEELNKRKQLALDNSEDLKQVELDFWKSKLALAEEGSREYLEIDTKITTILEERATKGKADQAKIAKDTAKEWVSVFNAIPTAFGQAMQGIGNSAHSLRDLFRGVFAEIAQMSAQTAAGLLRDHIATELAKKQITVENALEFILTEAKKAAAAAWTSIVGTPFIGPELAPGAAAMSMAGVLAFSSGISAAAGYDIPAGLNPMTQLHAQEMVLPAELANRVRAMAGGPGGGGGGGDTHVHIHTLDTVTMTQWAKANPEFFGVGTAGAIAINHSGLNKAIRNRSG